MRRKIPIPLPFSAQSGTQKKICLKNQMKRNQASERKHTLTSRFFHLLRLCTCVMAACSSEKSRYDFKNSQDAIHAYQDYVHAVLDMNGCSVSELTDFVCGWQELSDTVYRYISKDSAFTAHVSLSMDFQVTTDSMRTELLRLAGAHTWSMKDVAFLKLNTSPYRKDKELQSVKDKATAFYAALDRKGIQSKGDSKKMIREYIRFLVETRKQGIGNQEQMLAFIEKEDICFRSFLSHIAEYSDFDMTGITKTTEAVCAEIFRSASSRDIPSEDALVYMSMRTNRRLLQNAKVCADLIRGQKVKDARQANAYLWMTVQPFLSMDAVCISMLTEQQRRQLTEIADDYPQLVNILASKRLAEAKAAEEIPGQLAKLYIATL